jgi:hypothetical protein
VISTWGVEHGEISKSLVGQNKFVPAVKLGAKKLRAARERMLTDTKNAPKGGDLDLALRMRKVEGSSKKRDLSYPLPGNKKAGVYGRRGDARTDVVTEAKTMGDAILSELKGQATGKATFRSKSGKKYPVHLVPDYQNAHPIRTGSKKGGKTEIVSGRGLKNASTMRHEVLHADNKSSWRTAQINSRPRAQRREEARADTLSGTYKENTWQDMASGKSGGVLSHTAGNRVTPGRTSREFRRTQDQIFRSRGQSPRKESKKSGTTYIPTPGRPNDSQGKRMVRYGVAGGGAAGGYAGGKYADRKYRRDRNGKFS